MGNQSRRLVPVLVLALLTIVVLPYRGVVQAQTVPGTGSLLSNPLILHNPQTGATVQIMPTTSWLAQNPPPYAPKGGGSTSTSSGALPSPSCTLGADSSPDDAHVLVNNSSSQYDSLDLSAFGLSSDASNLTG